MHTLFVLALVVQVGAPDTHSSFSLKQAIEIAHQRNPALAASRQRVEAARGRLTSAKALPNPFVGKGPTILDVIDAQRSAVAARTEAYQAKANYRKALAELRRAVSGELRERANGGRKP